MLKTKNHIKSKEPTKYVTMVKSIPGATTVRMIYNVKGCMVDFAPDIVLLHCSRNNFKKHIAPQKIEQNILKLAEEVSDEKNCPGFWN